MTSYDFKKDFTYMICQEIKTYFVFFKQNLFYRIASCFDKRSYSDYKKKLFRKNNVFLQCTYVETYGVKS